MFDTHCHLNFKAFAEDASNVANAMALDDVKGLVVGTDRQTSRYAIDLAQTFSHLWASVGLHPLHVLRESWDPIATKELALEDKVVAIGEVGLDFDEGAAARAISQAKKQGNQSDAETIRRQYIDGQYATFRSALELALELDKPLILHSRNAYEELLKVLSLSFRAIHQRGKSRDDKLHGTIHCFTGNWAAAKHFLDLGFLIGFTGLITYAGTSELTEVIAQAPLERILIETDAPYLTPEPYRSEGKKNHGQVPRNLPQYVMEVAQKIADIRGLPLATVLEQTEANAKKLFRV